MTLLTEKKLNIISSYKTARGYLSDAERKYLYNIAGESDIIINVGIECGASVHCFREGNSDANIIAIDLIGNKKFEGDVGQAILTEGNIVDFSILDIMPDPIVMFVKANSNTLNIDLQSDLIFIDGCHWGQCLQNDIEKYSRLATKYLLFHDYSDAPPHAGVKKALDNWDCPGFKKTDQIDTIAVYERIQ